MLYCHIVLLMYCDIVVLSYCSVVLMMFLFLIVMLLSTNDSVYFAKHQRTRMSTCWHWKKPMLACRTQTSRRDIRCYCFWWGVWWDFTQLDANFLGYVWLGTNHANRCMLNMHLSYYKGNTIQQTPGAISRHTSWGNHNEP